jgi:hypothetical protein
MRTLLPAALALAVVLLSRPVSFEVVGCSELVPVGSRSDDGSVLVKDGTVEAWVLPGQSYCYDPREDTLYIWDGLNFVPLP